MTPSGGRVVLPPVRGWQPPPTVTVPVYEMAEWPGPQWLLSYDGTDDRDGLRFVHLAYGDALTRRLVAGIVTFAKQPAQDLGGGCWAPATDLRYVADSVTFHLLERLPHPAGTGKARSAWERARLQEVSSSEIEPPVWSPVTVDVAQSQLTGHRVDVEGGWAICLDAGEVFVGIFSAHDAPSRLTIQPVVDLLSYPLPSDTDHPSD